MKTPAGWHRGSLQEEIDPPGYYLLTGAALEEREQQHSRAFGPKVGTGETTGPS